MKTQRAVSFDESSMESCLLADHLQSRGLSSSAEQQQHQTQQPQQQQLHHQHKQQLHQTQQQQQQQQSNELLLLGSEEVQSLEEAKRVIGALKARQRAQAHQMLAWRRTLKLQEELVARLTREKADQLRSLSSQLLLFESRLCRKQKEIEASLAQRESIILRQQKVIKQLQSKLRIACNELLVNNNNHHSSSSSKQQDTASLLLLQQTMMRDSSSSPPCCDAFDRLDSLGDSDSAVVLEEAFSDDLTPPRFRSNFTDVTLIRSVSDAVEPKYNLTSRRSNGLLRRPEVLETVYSVEEDADGDNNSGSANNNGKSSSSTTTAAAAAATGKDHQAPSDEIEADEEDNVSTDATTQQRRRLYQHQHHQQQVQSSSPDENKRLRDIYGSFERLAEHNHQHHRQEHDSGGRSSCKQLLNSHNCCSQLSSNQRNTSRDDSQQAQVTYNRVMSNHRSVTKPKDVKYKRINKAKSKSLEGLRGRLRNWVEKGNKIAISLDQSYA